jgi:hypothetical protein
VQRESCVWEAAFGFENAVEGVYGRWPLAIRMRLRVVTAGTSTRTLLSAVV